MTCTTFTDYKQAIKDRLKQYRLDRELSLSQLSVITGLAASTLSNIELGKVDPEDMTVHKLRKTLPGLLDDLDKTA